MVRIAPGRSDGRGLRLRGIRLGRLGRERVHACRLAHKPGRRRKGKPPRMPRRISKQMALAGMRVRTRLARLKGRAPMVVRLVPALV